jgi:MFS transporter, YNFM family, putative membrane transport protein
VARIERVSSKVIPTQPAEHIRHGTPEFTRTTLALFSAGFATFALLYCVQPLMPVFTKDFHVGAAQSSLSLSLTTGLLAPAMILAGLFSESRGRKPMMVASLLASSVLTLVCAVTTHWGAFLVMRALAGLAFAGLPAISMAYLSEEVHPGSIGLAMGLSIGGNGLGGMIGRLLTALIADLFSWRYAMGVIGVLGIIATIIFWKTLPPSRHFTPRRLAVRPLMRTFGEQLRDPRLGALFAIGFLLMGAFVSTYNYISYHLLEAPYSLSQAAVGLIFVVYLVGIFASAFIGSRADRVGREKMLLGMIALMLAGVGLTLMRPLALVVLGIATVTFGFFGGHSVASSWVGLRAHGAKAQAAALYLFFYYVGASVAGPVGGMGWERWRWPGVAGFIVVLLMIALGVATASASAQPTAHSEQR